MLATKTSVRLSLALLLTSTLVLWASLCSHVLLDLRLQARLRCGVVPATQRSDRSSTEQDVPTPSTQKQSTPAASNRAEKRVPLLMSPDPPIPQAAAVDPTRKSPQLPPDSQGQVSTAATTAPSDSTPDDKETPLTSADATATSSELPPTSACLLFSDDQHWLPEWLAYHYYTANLQTVVLAVDPRSTTEPQLGAWTEYLDVQVWHDTDYAFRPKDKHANKGAEGLTWIHRGRQVAFYEACGRYLTQRNQTWTFFHDLDEYLAFNEDYVPDAKTKIRQQGGILRAFLDYHEQPDSVYHSVNCTQLPRVLFSNVDTPGVNSTRYTQRYRYHSRSKDKSNNGNPKSLVDVSKVDWDAELVRTHRVSYHHCAPDAPRRSPLRLHHYLGPWPAYARPSESRKGLLRNYQMWEYRSQIQDGGSTDVLVDWYEGFRQMVPDERLWETAGVLPHHPDPTEWSLSAEELKGVQSRTHDRSLQRWITEWLERHETA